ncbi:MAG: ABC transporter ATP-binding protein [Elusimicrobia bacterium]|nr:ABC transporter ATP-binding protein [Elusimicrobiota bacterium]
MTSKKVAARLAKFLKPYKTRLFAAFVCMVIVAALNSAMVYLLKPGLDKIISTKKYSLLLYFGGIMIFIVILHAGFSYIQNYLLAYIGQNVIIDLRNKIYEHMQRLSLSYYITHPTGSLLSRLTNDMMYIQNAVVTVPTKLIRDGLSCIGIFAILIYLNWKWTLLALVFSPLIVYPIGVFARKMRRTAKATQEKMAEIYTLLTEKISGIKVTKSFCQEGYEIDSMKKANRAYYNEIMRLLRANALQNPVLEVITYSISILVALFVIYSVFRGQITIGGATAFLAALIKVYAPVKNMADINKQVQAATSAAERIFSIADEKIQVKEKPGAVKFPGLRKEIKFENVSFSYLAALEQVAIKNINLSIKKGQIFALVGPSGGGKTTIANLIPRFFDPTEGRITFDGIDIRDFKISSFREKIGIVSQDIMLFNDTIKANIAYGYKKTSEDEIIKAAKQADAYDFIMNLPQKFDTVIGERGATLSGGMAQRICIARAIILNPEILILDEATSSLDMEAEKLIQQALKKIEKGRTTIVIAHRLSTVRRADNIAVISSGRIVEQGNHWELIKRNGLYSHLYNIDLTE